MNEFVERYVHQVGAYLPRKERADIEAELRSQIQDQLDDRYQDTPTQAEVEAVLAELGEPRLMAASYQPDRYLVGPKLYPMLMLVLRYGWLILPTIIVFLSAFNWINATEPPPLTDVVLETLLSIVQTVFGFSGVVVLMFAILERTGWDIDPSRMKNGKFDPTSLPKVDDPRTVDRAEAAGGIAFGTIVMLVIIYFVYVGGLTLRFNLSDPGDVIPFPTSWAIALIVSGFSMIIIHIIVLQRNRWSLFLWVLETVLEVFGMICAYFVIYQPLFNRLLETAPDLANLPVAEIVVVLPAVITLIGRGSKVVAMWNYQHDAPPSSVRTHA